MKPRIESRRLRTARQTTAYLECGPADGPLLIFIHGWPELSLMWRPALEHFGALGWRCIAPDMRGYGGSGVPAALHEYALETIVADMLELLESSGANRAVWVGHDWGSPVVWALAGHHPALTAGAVSLCVPYFAAGFQPETLIPYVDRDIYPEHEFPAGQWDYQLFYRTSFAAAAATFEADLESTFKALIRKGSPRHKHMPARLAHVRRDGGWFDGAQHAPDVARDPAVLSESDLAQYVAAFSRTGFSGADAWYMNWEANARYAASLPNSGRLDVPVLFIHAEYDVVCATLELRLAEPMRNDCTDLVEQTLPTGHWMVQEQPHQLNKLVEEWLGLRVPSAARTKLS